MAYQRRTRRNMASINVVPFIDVMLVLLVVFMVTVPLMMQGIKVDLPEANAKRIAHKTKPLIVTVDAKGYFYLSTAVHPEKPLAPQALLLQAKGEIALAKRAKMQQPILVKGDQKVDYGRVIAAMSILQKAGAEQVGLITSPEK